MRSIRDLTCMVKNRRSSITIHTIPCSSSLQYASPVTPPSRPRYGTCCIIGLQPTVACGQPYTSNNASRGAGVESCGHHGLSDEATMSAMKQFGTIYCVLQYCSRVASGRLFSTTSAKLLRRFFKLCVNMSVLLLVWQGPMVRQLSTHMTEVYRRPGMSSWFPLDEVQ